MKNIHKKPTTISVLKQRIYTVNNIKKLTNQINSKVKHPEYPKFRQKYLCQQVEQTPHVLPFDLRPGPDLLVFQCTCRKQGKHSVCLIGFKSENLMK